MKYCLLIPDALTRKGFDVASMLRRTFKDMRLLCGCSSTNMVKRTYIKMLYGGEPVLLRDTLEYFTADLNHICKKHQDEKIVFVPTEEIYVELFLMYQRNEGADNLISLLPTHDLFNTVRDKRSLNILCQEKGVGCPKFYSANDLSKCTSQMFPLILKPCVSSGSEGIMRLYSEQEVTQEVLNIISARAYHVQELIDGGEKVVGAFYLYNDGRFIDGYCHHRIRTSPKTGGVTVLSEMHSNNAVLEEGKKLLDKIHWNGLVMLEFIYDAKSDKYKVIEANPRLWGSVMLSEYSGANLLSNYVRLCVGEQLVHDDIRENAKIRWFFPVDLLSYVSEGFSVKGFWDFKDTCFINWTYAGKGAATIYNVVSLFDVHKIKRFFRR